MNKLEDKMYIFNTNLEQSKYDMKTRFSLHFLFKKSQHWNRIFLFVAPTSDPLDIHLISRSDMDDNLSWITHFWVSYSWTSLVGVKSSNQLAQVKFWTASFRLVWTENQSFDSTKLYITDILKWCVYTLLGFSCDRTTITQKKTE